MDVRTKQASYGRTDFMIEDDDDAADVSKEDGHDHQIHLPQQRNTANARERARMRVLSKAFCRLKTTLPWVPLDTKLSKLDTLRLATSYIAHLRAILNLSNNEAPDPVIQPVNMSWPFNFQANWEPQGRKSDGNISCPKNAWHSCTPHTGHTAQKKSSNEGCEAFCNMDSETKHVHYDNKNARTKCKNEYHYYENHDENEFTSRGVAYLDSSHYQSCAYFGQS